MIFPAIFFIAIIGYGIYTKTHQEEYHNKGVCMMFYEMKERSINGRVTSKFKDTEHHLVETILVNNDKIDVGLDVSGFYDFVLPGDSIFKKKNSTLIEVHRNGSEQISFLLDYGCKEKL